jgi:hypothetical protein
MANDILNSLELFYFAALPNLLNYIKRLYKIKQLFIIAWASCKFSFTSRRKPEITQVILDYYIIEIKLSLPTL